MGDMTARTIAVVGATGAQGGGLARAILADPGAGFHLRALTRDSESRCATALHNAGAHVVEADLDDVDSLRAALQGCDIVFATASYWEHRSARRALAQAQHLATAVRDCGVPHVIWSTFEDSRSLLPEGDDSMPPFTAGFRVPQHDVLAASEHDFVETGATVTFLHTSFQWDWLLDGLGPRPVPNGRVVLALPLGDAALCGIAAEDIGRCAMGLLRDFDANAGQRIGIMGEQCTGAGMAATLTRVLGVPVDYFAVEPDAFRAFGMPCAREIGNMLQLARDYEDALGVRRCVARSRALNPQLQSFAQWAAANAARISLQPVRHY